MRDLNTIWKRPMYLPYLQPSLTDDLIDRAEVKIGYRLPKELIDLLKIQNGGYIRKSLNESNNKRIYGIGPYYPSLIDFDWSEDQEYVGFDLSGLIPFDGDGHWHLCLDYRKNKIEPQVTLIDIDCEDQTIIAQSFAAYLDQLELIVNDELVIYTSLPIEQLVMETQELLGVKFEQPDSNAHGYDTYRSTYNEGWIWLSPNDVPVGFVRDNENRYDELVPLSEGNTKRYPEISESCFLMSFSNSETSKTVLRILKDMNHNAQFLSNIVL